MKDKCMRGQDNATKPVISRKNQKAKLGQWNGPKFTLAMKAMNIIFIENEPYTLVL